MLSNYLNIAKETWIYDVRATLMPLDVSPKIIYAYGNRPWGDITFLLRYLFGGV